MVVMNKRGRRSYVDHYADRKKQRPEPNRAYNAVGAWSEDQIVFLRALCENALSYNQLTDKFNARFPESQKSRCALLGKAARLGLKKPDAPHWKTASSYAGAGRMVQTRKALVARHNAKKPKYDKRMVRSQDLAPVTFKHNDPAGLRSDEESRIPRLQGQGRGHAMRVTPEQLAKRRMGTLPCIVEDKPLTSISMLETERDTCKWPTSEDVRDMQVCGAPAMVGAYCERHGQIAYREMPTVKRNRCFHKDNEEYRSTTKHAPALSGVKNGSELYKPTLATLETANAQWIADQLLKDVVEPGDIELLPDFIGTLDE